MMANRKYAENLIGNWNKDQYQPQRDVAISTYQTNWDRLQNDFDKYVSDLKRNLDRARVNYYDELTNAERNNAFRTNAIMEDLSSRGLLNSGFSDNLRQASITAKGDEIGQALDKIVNTSVDYGNSLGDITTSIANKQKDLNVDLYNTLSGITGAEEDNAQAYAGLRASLANAKDARDAANAAANASRNAENESDELERRLAIAETLESDKLSDNEKVRYLSIYLDVPADIGEQVVKGYNDNKSITKYEGDIQNLQNKEPFNIPPLLGATIGGFASPQFHRILGANSGYSITNLINDLVNKSRENKINNLKNDLNSLTYTDIYNLLYGNK